jgi:hypothetical protein
MISTRKASRRSQNAFCRARSFERVEPLGPVLAQKQRLQQVFFPDGICFDGKKLVGTGTTLPVFNYLSPVSDEEKELVDLTGIVPAGGAAGAAACLSTVRANQRPSVATELVDLTGIEPVTS